MNRFVWAALAATISLACVSFGAQAQTAIPTVVASCGTAQHTTVGQSAAPTVDTNGNWCTNGTGGGGGAVTIADGADVAEGSTTDAVCSLPASGTACTVVALLKAIGNSVSGAIPAGTNQIGHVIIDAGTALVGNFGVAQASTTSGQSGPLSQCAVTTSAPTYTTAQTDPLSCDTSGNLRVNIGSAPANQSVNVAQVNGVTTLTGAGATGTGSQRVTAAQDTTTIAGSAPGTAGTASSNVVTVQGIASMTKLLVTPDANSAVNVAQFGGNAVVTGVGASGNGIPRVTLSNDSVLAANQSVNLAQVAGATTATGHGTASGTLRVELPTDGTGLVTTNPATAANWGVGATGSAVPANGIYHAGDAVSAEPSKATTGNLTGTQFDLTGKQVTSPYAIRELFVSGSASTTGNTATEIIAAPAASVKLYITDVECGRNDAGTSAIIVTFNDSASTVLVLPNSGGGGGNNKTFNVPLTVAAATHFTFTSGTSTTTVYCSAQGYKGY